jgi:hypothetical protein
MANLIAVNLLIDSDLFSEGLPSISAYRAVSALAIIPVSHLILCIWSRAPLRSLAGLTGLAQVALFIFVMWSRSSAQWGLMAVLVATALFGLKRWAWSYPNRLTVWPILALMAGVLGLSLYSTNALNPAYFTDELLPNHFTWHSAYLGLAVHPKWSHPEQGDAIAFLPAAEYLAENRPDLAEKAPLTNSYWLRLHDQIVRHLFLKFAYEHPRYMMELYAWWKPVSFVKYYYIAMQPLLRGFQLAGLVGLVMLASAAALLLRDAWRQMMLPLLIITGIVVLASYAPLMWAYPAPFVMLDAVWTTTVFLLVLAAAAGNAGIRLLRVLRLTEVSFTWPTRLTKLTGKSLRV